MTERIDNQLWAIVLAAGEGKRLVPLTRALYGWELPKQFAEIARGRSLLQETMDRIVPLVPRQRTIVVVGQEHESLARLQLGEYDGVEIVVQPLNLDTGPGILLPLAHVLARDPDASVVVLPSDHYVANPEPFIRALSAAGVFSRRSAHPVTLLGVVPDRAETEYGWIVPGNVLKSGAEAEQRSVRRFVEKPPLGVAQTLLRHGALWNTFVSAGRVSSYWKLARKHLPEQAAAFELYALEIERPGREAFLRSIYAAMKPANFSKDVLERAEELAVVPVSGSGWSDWGSPSRIFHSLKGTAGLERLRGRMLAAAMPSRLPNRSSRP